MLYSYKMTSDSGFAPNPFFGFMTLATCKPQIRKKKRIGDYIAGFTSKQLCNDPPGQERLVFIMKLTNKISYDEYWDGLPFALKKPSKRSTIETRGDNIYKPALAGRSFTIDNYEQIPNLFHHEKERPIDVSGQFVLLSNDFYYFGAGAILVNQFAIRIPRTQSSHGVKTTDEGEIEKMIDYITARYPQNAPIEMPHNWPRKLTLG
jgi:hypothetical protein